MLKIILFMLLPLTLAAAPKVAVFDEPGFPNASSRNADWYMEAVGPNARKVNLRSMRQLEGFDVIIFPHGGYLPLAAEEAVGALMARGGTVIVSGEMQTPVSYPPDIASLHNKAKNEGGAALLKFQEKYGTDSGSLLVYAPELKRWISPVAGFHYNSRTSFRIMEEFALTYWPNPWQSSLKHYARPFNQPVYLNPKLKITLPSEVKPVQKNIRLARLAPVSHKGDYAFNVFIPIYLFAQPGGIKYAAFPQAGKSPEDCATDFFIFRRNELNRIGSTLIVMGTVGRQLLESDTGTSVLKAMIELAQTRLPGELSRDYIRLFYAVEKAMSGFNNANQTLYGLLSQYAAAAHASGDSIRKQQLLNEIKLLQKDFNRMNNEFSALIRNKNDGIKVSEDRLAAMTRELAAKTAASQRKITEMQKLLTAAVHPPVAIPVRHGYGKLIFNCSKFGPWGTYGTDALWRKLVDIGITEPEHYSSNWKKSKRLNDKFGFTSGYHLWHIGRGHPDLTTVNSGVLDLRTGTVKPKKERVFDNNTPDLDNTLSRILREANRNPGIGVVIHGDERDFGWSLWGDYLHGKFMEYLKNKYRTINILNKEYGGKFKDFKTIKLPLKRPETQSEHALWEDWTRYREIYRLEYEMKNHVELVKKNAPSKRQWLYGSYYRHNHHPANGINYYEYGRLVDPACLESGPRLYQEIIANDITAFNKKHVNTEWSAFYFPAKSERDSINRLRGQLWNEVNLGTIGWFLFMGGQAYDRWSFSNLITPAGLVRPLGYELRKITREFKAAQNLFLDGKRAEPVIRILLSPTTRRHSSWPDIEADKSLESVTGYYEAFQRLHYPARAIDEMAVMEGRLPQACRFLFVPQVTYMNRELFTRLEEFMKNGGTVIATPDSGRFDQYGHIRNYLTGLAAVLTDKAVSPAIGDDRFKVYAANTFSLKPLFGNETSSLLKYADGTPAATETRIGKGCLVLVGFPFGREYYAAFNKNEKSGLPILKTLAEKLKIPLEYECSDTHLVVRPWELDGQKFLNLNYRYRPQAVKTGGGFPLASAPAMVDFDLKIAGQVDVEDYLLGLKMPTVFDGQMTTVKGIIENPGGKIYKIIPARNKPVKAVSQVTRQSTLRAPVRDETSIKLPFSGRLFVENGEIKIGSYLFHGEIENEGAWSGKFFAIFKCGNQRIRHECRKDTITKFRFARKTVSVKCTDVTTYMPANIRCTITESENQPASEVCKIRRESFLGQDSLVLINPYLFVRILPKLGGRIVELRTAPDAPNQMVCNASEIASGPTVNYRDYGGLEVNPGAYQATGWETRFQTGIIENSPEKISICLSRSKPVKWEKAHGRWKKSGHISYEMFFTIEKSSSMLEVQVRQYNELLSVDSMVLRTHPAFCIAGDCNFEDTVFYVGEKNRTIILPYRFGRSKHLPNFGSWYAYIDRAAGVGVLQDFPGNAVGELYVWTGDKAGNVEICFNPIPTAPGKYAEFRYRLGIITGLTGINIYQDDIAVEAAVNGSGVYGNNQMVSFSINTTATTFRQVKMNARITGNGRTIHVFPSFSHQLTPAAAVSDKLEWNSGDYPDGEYQLEITCNNAIKCSQSFRLNGISEKAAAGQMIKWQNSFLELQDSYRKNPSPELRNRIFLLATFLNSWQTTGKEEKRKLAEKITKLLYFHPSKK